MTEMVTKAVFKADADELIGQSNAAAKAIDAVGARAANSVSGTKALSSATDQLAQAEARAVQESAKALNAISAKSSAEARAITSALALSAAQERAARTETARGAAMEAATRINGRSRAGLQQLGFQLNDVTAQMSTGTAASVIFAQQSGQVLQALQLMGGGAEGAKGKLGGFISFLGGPWGLAISLAVSAIGLFSKELFGSEEAAKKVTAATDGMAAAQSALGGVFDLATGKIKSQNEMLLLNARLQGLTLRTEAREQKNSSAGVLNRKARGFMAVVDYGANSPEARRNSALAAQLAYDVRSGRADSGDALSRAAKIDYSRLNITAEEFQQAIIDGLSARLKRKTADMIDKSLKDGQLDVGLRKSEKDAKAKPASQSSSAEAAASVRFISPLANGAGVSSGFGGRRPPKKGASSNHPGVDYAVAAGTDVRAPQYGVVTRVGSQPNGAGNWVEIDHGGGTTTRYYHLSAIAAREGQAVEQGQVFAQSGNSGNSTGAHLHYEVRRNGKPVDPTKAAYAADGVAANDRATAAAEAAAKAEEDRLKQLAALSERAGKALGGINDRYHEQPRLIAEAAAVTRELDGIIGELAQKKPPGFEAMIADAERLKKEVPAILLDAPFKALREKTQFMQEQQGLILQGRQSEAKAMEIIAGLQAEIGGLTAEQRGEVVAMVEAEERINDLLDKREAILSIYTAAISDLRGSLEDLLSGGSIGDFLKRGKQNILQLQGRMLTETLFGDALNGLDKLVQKRTVMDGAIENFAFETLRVKDETASLADKIAAGGDGIAKALAGAAARLNGEAAGPVGSSARPAATVAATSVAILARLANLGQRAAAASGAGEIVVNGGAAGKGTAGATSGLVVKTLSVGEMAGEMAKAVTGPLVLQLDKMFGVSWFSRLQGVFSGALAGYWRAGGVGAVLGGAQGLSEMLAKNGLIGSAAADKISKGLSGALDGAQTGGQIAQLGKALGLKTSTTGGQIGGAIGSAIPIPGGSIIGSVIGSLVGGLFKKTPTGAVVLGNGSAATSGKLGDQLGSIGSGVQDALAQIAQQLGAELGDYKVSIGQRKDYYRVSASGSSAVGDKNYPKNSGGDVLYDGKDQAAAVRAALLNAIQDGGIKGVSAAVQKALNSNKDIDKALEEALKVRKVEEIIGGLTAALTRQFKEFESQAAERVRIAREYGFDVVEIEKYNAEARAKLTEEILAQRVGSLQSFVNDMRIGSLFEGSAADQRAALIGEIARVQGDAKAGKDGAADQLATLSRQLVDLSKSAYGTAGPEYGADRAKAVSAAEEIIRIENERVEAARQAQIATAAAVETGNALLDENNSLLAGLGVDIAAIRAALTASGQSANAADLSALARITAW